MDAKKIRWAIIGAGGIADRRAIPALLLDEENEILAVMDKVPSVAKSVAEKYSVEKYYTDVEEMLLAKKNNSDPAMLILKKIEDFRLSI